ncbi:MAG TPA: PQQ-binding-like beta-propeller repeat protein [Thermoanaerobaculia bacterium]
MRRRSLVSAFLLLALGLTVLSPLSGGDWPAWRGARGDGIVDQGPLPERWPEEGLPTLWRRQLGAGFSGITAAGGMLFTAYGDGDQEYCAAIDAETGREVWRQPLGASFLGGDPSGGPRATPVVDEGRVYAVGSHGRLWSFDAATGKPLWDVDLLARFKAKKPMYGIASSPLIHEDLLLFNVGGPQGRSLVAFDKKTGTVRWTSADDPPAYSTPVVREIAGRKQAVFFTARGLVGADLASGAVLWRFDWETYDDANAMTPIVDGDRVFISSSSGALLIEVRQQEDGSLRAVEVWRNEDLPTDYSNLVLAGGHLYGVSGGALFCVELATGKRRWEQPGFRVGSVLGFSNRKLVATEYECSLTLAELSPEGYKQRGRFTVFPRARCITGPTVAGGRLFLRNEKEIIALKLSAEAAPSAAGGAPATP